MDIALDERALPRQPRQQRAIDRFEAVLDAARRQLAESGLNGFSIPAVAARLGYTRASIYKFFPTPYAILNELVRRHFAGLERELAAETQPLAALTWQDLVHGLVRTAAAYHNANPIGMMLSLGGPVTDESYRSYALTIQHLGALAAQLLGARGVEVKGSAIDVAALAVDLGTTCFRHGFLRDGRIGPEYQSAAATVMIDFISRQLLPSRGTG